MNDIVICKKWKVITLYAVAYPGFFQGGCSKVSLLTLLKRKVAQLPEKLMSGGGTPTLFFPERHLR